MVSKITRDLRPPRSHGKHWKPAPHPLDLDIQTHGAGHEFGQDIPATIEIRTWFRFYDLARNEQKYRAMLTLEYIMMYNHI